MNIIVKIRINDDLLEKLIKINKAYIKYYRFKTNL